MGNGVTPPISCAYPTSVNDYAPAQPVQYKLADASPGAASSGPGEFEKFPDYQEPAYFAPAETVTNQHGYVHNPLTANGIPQSHSYNSVQTLMSPGPAHKHFNGEGSLSSPEIAQFGHFTEPRNYAPRTAGLPISNDPPPRFDLGSSPYMSQEPSKGFYSPQQANNGAMVVHSTRESSSLYQPATALAHVQSVQSQRSEKLIELTNTSTGLPSFKDAMKSDNFPFIEGSRQSSVINYGVIKLKNIPFSTKRSEVIAFLGRNCKILNDKEEPVHIIMERVTSKTMDAYVEFQTLEDAMKTAERHYTNVNNGRISRLGDRPVEVELSSQASLMRDLFPLAVGLVWNGAVPQFNPFSNDEPWENFKGFISEEEMTMLVKHVEVPHRSPFSKECPQRPYECLISTLKKFPWYITDRITIGQRQAIFKATCELVRLLSRSVQKKDDVLNLSIQLYRRVIAAAMDCPGFTPMMKDDIAWMVNMEDLTQRAYGQPRFADCWRHQHAITPKPGLPLDVIEWYIAIIREQTHRDMSTRPLNERNDIQERSQDTDMYWGFFWAEIGYPMGPAFDNMTLARAGHMELSAIDSILARAFGRN